jgi:hypothetical protein
MVISATSPIFVNSGYDTQKNENASSLMPSERKSSSDTVTFSDKAVALAKNAVSSEKLATSDTNSSVSTENYPLEAYSYPSWFDAYIPDASRLTGEINHKYWDLAEKYYEDNHYSEDEKAKLSQVRNNDPNRQAELEKEVFRNKYNKELSEYGSILHESFKDALVKNGVNSTADYYEKVILDKGSSETIHQDMSSRLADDPRALELMQILGITQ